MNERMARAAGNGLGGAVRPATAATRRVRRTAGTAVSVDELRGDAGKGRPTPSREGRRPQGSPIVRVLRFLREVVAELRKVIWPDRKEQVTYTIVVLFFVSLMVALVAALDLAFAKGVFYLFG